MQCQSSTSKGLQCKNTAKIDSPCCHVHQDSSTSSQSLRSVQPKECFGWRECGRIIQFKDIDVWEIPGNTIMYKGVRPENEDTPNEYIEDIDYLPDNFIFLAG